MVVGIADGNVVRDFPPRAQALVLEWWRLNRAALVLNWIAAREGRELSAIPGLE